MHVYYFIFILDFWHLVAHRVEVRIRHLQVKVIDRGALVMVCRRDLILIVNHLVHLFLIQCYLRCSLLYINTLIIGNPIGDHER